jgi:polysaccharide deacetylase family protein (PEP-CTERM system associated)
MITSAFTIDVECGVNISMRDYFNVQMPPTERVVTNTQAILRLLSKHGSKATFFVLGDVARHFPGLIKDIAADGHEIGVHSYAHHRLFKLSEEEAYNDTKQGKDVIENVIGRKTLGYRAPAFSVMPQTAWALPMLADLGFVYDSSIMPVKTQWHGWQGFSKDVIKINLPGGRSIVEFPLSTTQWMGKPIPACGGGYLKWFPFWFTKKTFAAINKTRPVNLYMHPYEIDTVRYPDYFFDELKKLSLMRQLKLRSFSINKETVLPKLDKLLGTFAFDTMHNIIEDLAQQGLVHAASLDHLLPGGTA